MKPLNALGVTFALLLASATTVLASDHATLSAVPGRGSMIRHVAASGHIPPTADILRGPYEWSAEVVATADVLREGYEEIGPHAASDLASTSPD